MGKIPFWQWPQVILVVVVLLYIGKPFFVPVGYAVLLSFLLYPLCLWLEQRGLPRGLAIGLVMLIVPVLVALLFLLLWAQLGRLWQVLPLLSAKGEGYLLHLRQWAAAELGVSLEQQMRWLENSLADLWKLGGAYLGGTLSLTVDLMIFLVVVPFMAVLLLHGRERFVVFLYDVLPAETHLQIRPVLFKAINTFYAYIKGLLVVYAVVAILNTLGLWLLGVQNALFYGVITALLTIVPYVGIMVGAFMPMADAWLNLGIGHALGVALVFGVVQYVEANIIFPIAVGRQLQISNFATLLALLVGGLLWGGSGLILFLPFVAIFKLVADEVPALQALGRLLGDNTTASASPLAAWHWRELWARWRTKGKNQNQ